MARSDSHESGARNSKNVWLWSMIRRISWPAPTCSKLRTAVAERPGPVHITTGADVVGAKASDTDIRLPPMIRGGGGFEIFTTDSAPDAADMIRSARRPVTVAGIGAARAEATDALTRFAEETPFEAPEGVVRPTGLPQEVAAEAGLW